MRVLSYAVATILAATHGAIASTAGHQICHCLPGDSCWPAPAIWNALNSTLRGRLVATVPIGSPCHNPHYDQAACAALQAGWTEPQTQSVTFPGPPYLTHCPPNPLSRVADAMHFEQLGLVFFGHAGILCKPKLRPIYASGPALHPGELCQLRCKCLV